MRLTVFFDGRFWTGVFEWEYRGIQRAQRHVLGTEPSGEEILELVKGWEPTREALGTEPGPEPTAAGPMGTEPRPANPKRLAREATRLLAWRGESTKAQEALSRQREEGKKEARKDRRARRETDKERRRGIARRKAREKHKGH